MKVVLTKRAQKRIESNRLYLEEGHPTGGNPQKRPHHPKIAFLDPILRGEYNLVVSTRCGDGRDYALRRIGHPVTAP